MSGSVDFSEELRRTSARKKAPEGAVVEVSSVGYVQRKIAPHTNVRPSQLWESAPHCQTSLTDSSRSRMRQFLKVCTKKFSNVQGTGMFGLCLFRESLIISRVSALILVCPCIRVRLSWGGNKCQICPLVMLDFSIFEQIWLA